MFRKQIAAILAAVLVLSLGTACASQNTAPSGAADEAAVVEDEGMTAEESAEAVDAEESAGAGSTQGDNAQEEQAAPAAATAEAAQDEQGAPAAATAQAAQDASAPAAEEGSEEAQGNPAPAMVKGEPETNTDVILPGFTYTLRGVKEVDGRQGIACENGEYWVSGSTTLTHYDKGWKAVATNNDPFKEFEVKVNHIGDIDVYNGEIYVGAENFADGVGSDIQIAVYDAQTLQLSRTYMFNKESGQEECSGIAVDPDTKSIWMCSWVGDESGRYLYRDGRVHRQDPPPGAAAVAAGRCLLQRLSLHDGG